jgi:hypothetical protein
MAMGESKDNNNNNKNNKRTFILMVMGLYERGPGLGDVYQRPETQFMRSGRCKLTRSNAQRGTASISFNPFSFVFRSHTIIIRHDPNYIIRHVLGPDSSPSEHLYPLTKLDKRTFGLSSERKFLENKIQSGVM